MCDLYNLRRTFMHITCKKEILQKAVHLAENIISAKSTLSILSNILFKVSGNAMTVFATNLEESIIQKIPVTVEKEGEITVNAKTIGNILRLIPMDNDVSIAADNEKNIRVTCSGSETTWDLMGVSSSDYPQIPKLDKKNSFTIDQKIMRMMIQKTVFAVSTENTKYILNGVCFELEKNTVKMIATDGRRLSFIQAAVASGIEKKNIIIPQKILSEVLRTLADEGTLEITLSDKQIAFKVDSIELISQLIEGEFPNYEQVVPKHQEYKVEFSTSELDIVLSQVSVMASDKGSRVIFSFSSNSVTLSSNDPDRGESHSQMKIAFESNDTFEIAFNSKFLHEILKVIESDSIIFEMKTPTSPTTVKEVGNTDFFTILMPIKIT